MSQPPDYLDRNRREWTKWSESFCEPGRKSWAADQITWGNWSLPESQLRALGELTELRGMDVIELGCGTAYFSAWMAKLGAKPVGIDLTPAQLANARQFQAEFGIEFPLIEGNAEAVPLRDASFDYAISEYGASIWCDPYKWIPEAARLLRPGGTLVFLRNSTIATLCMPPSGPVKTELQRSWFGLNRIEWADDESVEFHITPGAMIALLRECGFEVEALIDIRPPDDVEPNRHDYMTTDFALQWPSEEIWRARKR